MEAEIQKLKQLIEKSERILVTSHISPDPDAVSSSLLMADTLRLNYPQKQINLILEEAPFKLDFLSNYSSIKFQPIHEALPDFQPDLLILLDGNNYDRASRHSGDKLREYLTANSTKTAIIDHHEPSGKDATDVYINQHSPACVQDVYEICFSKLNLKTPKDAAETTMVGLYADSGGFVYVKDGTQKRVFDLVGRLLEAGASVEITKNRLNQFSSDDIKTLSTLLSNVHSGDDYTYSFLSDEFIDKWLAGGKTYPQLQIGTGTFLNEYVRNIEGREWGFIIYKNKLQGEDYYAVSFRSVGSIKDVAELATKLGGGGHKPAAGAKFTATSLKDAIDKVKQAIAAN
jgi:phosphoesterase RecJ-like protein